MAGRRGANLRGGDLAEGLGVELLRPFAAVAPVPRTEDVGIDAIATLLHPSGALLIAGESFAVQIKSASVREIEFQEHEYEWLRSLRLPFFVMSVDLASAQAELFSTHRVLLMPASNKVQRVTMYLDSRDGSVDSDDDHDHGPDVRAGHHHVYLGKPMLRWTALEVTKDEQHDRLLAALVAWVNFAIANLLRVRSGWYAVPAWRTNDVPTQGYVLLNGAVAEKEVLAFVAEHVAPFLLSLADNTDDRGRGVLSEFAMLLDGAGLDTGVLRFADVAGMLRRRAT